MDLLEYDFQIVGLFIYMSQSLRIRCDEAKQCVCIINNEEPTQYANLNISVPN